MEDAKRGKYQQCMKGLMFQGFTKREAELACAKWLTDDEELSDSNCLSRKISIFSNEHPEWEHDKVIAAAHAYCGLSKKGDAIDLSNIIERSKSLSLSKFSTMIV